MPLVNPVPPLATGSVPLTWLVRLTPESVPPSVKLPDDVTVPVSVIPLTVPVPPTDVTVPLPVPAPRLARAVAASVAPVPPDATGNVPVVKADVLVAYTAPPDVNDVNPVPPLVVATVPARVTAPVVAVDGVRPVVPPLMLVTPAEPTEVNDQFASVPEPPYTSE